MVYSNDKDIRGNRRTSQIATFIFSEEYFSDADKYWHIVDY